MIWFWRCQKGDGEGDRKAHGTTCSALRSSYCIIKSHIWLLNLSSNLEVIRLGRHDYRLRTREDYSAGHYPVLSLPGKPREEQWKTKSRTGKIE